MIYYHNYFKIPFYLFFVNMCYDKCHNNTTIKSDKNTRKMYRQLLKFIKIFLIVRFSFFFS